MITTPPTDALRDRIDAAIRPTMLLGLQDAELHDAPGAQRIGEWVDWISETVAAAIAEDRATQAPARDCPDHGDPIECACQAARGQADERRERYAAAIQRNVTDGIGLNSVLPEVYDAADAAMAVADQELTQVREELEDANGDIAEMQRDIARLRKQSAEVRAAALTEAADFLRDAHFRDGMSVQEIGTALRHTAAAARLDDTTGAPASCWCGHPEHRHYTGNTRATFPNGCKDCPGWNGAHTYGQELPWAPETDDTTGA